MSNRQTCKIVSLNVRGIRDSAKRGSIFSYLKDYQATFYFLQETYSDRSDESAWRKEWDGEIFFSHGSRHSRGVCILIDPGVKVDKMECHFNDASGRIVLITLILNDLKLSLCNIYAPNNHADQLEFIRQLNSLLIDKSDLTALIIGGDWNCALSKKDKRGGLQWKPTMYRNSILITMEMFDLVDIQRVKHPNVNKYSYVSKALNVKSRIDFFLIAKGLIKYVRKSDVLSSIAPDHKSIHLSLAWTKESPRGPGFWKFNNTLLNDENYVKEIRNMYQSFRKKYCYVEDKQLFWELLKMEIRSTTISFAKRKANWSKSREFAIKQQLNNLDDIICNSDDLQNVSPQLDQYEELKNELQKLYQDKGEGAKFRSKSIWIEHGERPTKYFFNLEKRNYKRRVITELEDGNGKRLYEEQILAEIEAYYKNLYSSKIDVTPESFSRFNENLETPRLTNEESANLEGLLSYEECKETLKTFQHGKSPGEDGFTTEFYLEFFDLLGED